MSVKKIAMQRKIRQSDIDEFEKLFRSLYGPLCRYAFRYVRDWDAAEEVVQDFFYNYWKNRGSITVKISLKAYFYRSIRNNALRYIEHLNITRKYAQTVIDSGEEYGPAVASDELELQELNAIIEQTLNELPERTRRVFKLSRFEGLKYQEIAELLSVSIKTVEADMGRALQLFRKKLKRYDEYAF
jgi:RNA polymerase sigma-70 factor, Bacteroides expansion family 1